MAGSGSSDANDPTAIRPGDGSSSRPPAAESRFTPGSIIGNRYRIVTLLGEGGMGQVYRADDLKLGQRVALKYVASSIADDPILREHLISEVRLGRQISHPNVCRLYDIVEVDDHQFISMEYVEGEDLASLLRRIGRLPGDKAISIAKDLCAGLAAAHDRGIVHRDLKPGNILIDDRGRARITDFGLARLAEDLRHSSELVGTPAYMAPEQLDGREVTVRSDIYALGLILYEIFTGRRLFEGGSLPEIREQHTTTKTRPSSIVPDVDPAIERVILRCLEEEPSNRPGSVHAVIAALPGGDPLLEAIRAGETPSPEMVAAAGTVGDLSLPVAWTTLLTFVLLLITFSWLAVTTRLPAKIGGVRPDAVLAEQAQRLARMMTPAKPADWDQIWTVDRSYDSWLRENAAARYDEILATSPPSMLHYIYRESPGILVPEGRTGRVSVTNPARTTPGMVDVTLDHQGHLIRVVRVPEDDKDLGASSPVDWKPWIEATGLDPEMAVAVAPKRNPPVPFDAQFAWEISWPADPSIPIRIEAASLGGAPVWVEMVGPWTRAGTPSSVRLGVNALILLVMVATIAAMVFARRNVLRGQGDRKGAFRLAGYLALVTFIGSVAIADHVPLLGDEWENLLLLAGISLVSGGQVWLSYLAVEPYVRRRWPRMLISWQRLIAGRFRDPMVGRDLLIGAIGGLVGRIAWLLYPTLAQTLGGTVSYSPAHHLAGLSSPFGIIWTLTHYQYIAVFYSLGWLIILLLLRLLFRRLGPSIVAVAVVTTPVNFMGEHYLSEGIVSLLVCGVLAFVLYRFGTLALAVSFFVMYIGLHFYSLSEPRSVLVLAAIIAIGLYGFRISLAGKPLFGAMPLEEGTAEV